MFAGKRRDMLKILFWDATGYSLSDDGSRDDSGDASYQLRRRSAVPALAAAFRPAQPK